MTGVDWAWRQITLLAHFSYPLNIQLKYDFSANTIIKLDQIERGYQKYKCSFAERWPLILSYQSC